MKKERIKLRKTDAEVAAIEKRLSDYRRSHPIKLRKRSIKQDP
jgi:hypothetical protein